MKKLILGFLLGQSLISSVDAQQHGGSIHWSLFPGFSNHGVLEMRNEYRASFNLTAGTTWQVRGLEISGLSSYNYRYFSGIQISGLSNISGVYNAIQPKEQIDETFRGIQAAGIINKTLGAGVGAQVASINSTGGHFTGFQWAGLFNYARSLQGVQLAGLLAAFRLPPFSTPRARNRWAYNWGCSTIAKRQALWPTPATFSGIFIR